MANQYFRSVKRTVHDNGPVFGYSIVITASVAILNTLQGSPSVPEIILASLSATLGFSLLEIFAYFKIKDQEEKDVKVEILGNAINFLSISVSLLSVLAVGLLTGKTAAWILAPFVGTLTYVLMTALQLRLIHFITRKTNLNKF